MVVSLSGLLLLLSLFAGCTSLGPAPHAGRLAVGDRSLPKVVAVAETLRNSYLERADAQRREERFAGLGLIGLGLIAGDLAMRGVGTNEVLGLGLAGVGLHTSNNWANPRAEALVYLEGAGGVQCALTAMSQLNAAYRRRDELDGLITRIRTNREELKERIKAFTVEEAAVVRARNAVVRAEAMQSAAGDALARLDSAGEDLYAVLGEIEVQVSKMQFTVSPDFGALVASLVAQKIIAPSPLTQQKTDGPKTASNAEQQLDPLTRRIELDIAAVESILALVNAKSAAAALQSCKVNLSTAGITMKVDPATVVVQAGTTVTALASGGVPSYSATWHPSAAPTELVTYKVELNGVISIEAKSGAKTGTYALVVVDGGRGRESLMVIVTAGSMPTPPLQPDKQAPKVACTSPVPQVKAVQDALIKKEITTVKIDGKEQTVVADGCQGPVTNEAMKEFFRKEMKLTDEEITKDPARLLQESARELKVTDATQKPATAACSSPSALIKAVQEALVNEGVKSVKVNNKEQTLVADGCQGAITNEAMKQFYVQKKQVAANDVESDPVRLLDKISKELKVAQKE